jgi:hypothetical protein
MMVFPQIVGTAVSHAKRYRERAADGDLISRLKMRCRQQKIKPEAIKSRH